VNVRAPPSWSRASTVDDPRGRELVEAAAVDDPGIRRTVGAQRGQHALGERASATPMTWRRTRPGFAIGRQVEHRRDPDLAA
jgi:hypothetical protein